MKIRFSIHYHTTWGQQLRMGGSLPALGAWDAAAAAVMAHTPGGTWVLEIELPALPPGGIEYKYFIHHEASRTAEWEWGRNRRLVPPASPCDRIEVRDCWRLSGRDDNPLHTSAFSRVVFRRPAPAACAPSSSPAASVHRFRLPALRVPPGLRVCILGSDPALGSWNESRPLLMDDATFPLWHAEAALSQSGGALSYKYALWDSVAGRVAAWEDGENRTLWIWPPAGEKRLTEVNDEGFRHAEPPWRGAGVNIPVFSLRSRTGMGVGEFADLEPLVDWAREAGLRMIQVLPVNDTIATHTWQDSYPYAAISVFALHPIYMNLDRLAESVPGLQWDDLRAEREGLNALPQLDYERVMLVKSIFYKRAYDLVRDAFLRDADYLAFFEENRSWLVPYAVFSCLRDRYGTSDHTAWGAHARMAAGEIERFAAPDQPHYHDVAVHYFIQFHLHRQLLAAATYAREHGIVLKGDIPIGVYRHSVDTWVAPELFHMDRQAGAPPDDFSASGQNWRFPTYNWEAMANDGFAWWRARLRKMSAYFDAFRIDHILGFFRIWEIPQNQVEGLLGSFSPSLPMSRGEIESWIGWFDQDRLCRPYIRPGMLESRFGAFAADALRECLEEGGPGILRLRPGFESQREVEARFPDDPALPAEQKARHAAMRAGLFSLIAEVLFLEGPGGGGQTFHPRHSLHRTQSYADLDASTKSRLNDLYVHYYYRRHEQFWREQALARLPAVKNATDMLICGEDLGMVPDCVAGVMREMEVLSLFIQRMPKDPRQEFHHPGHSPYWSVCATGSHDMSTLRAWWEEDRERSARFFRQVLGRQDTPPYFAEPWLCTEIVAQHLRSPCMWAVFPLQDLLGMDASTRCQDPRTERINVPSEPRHYWRYRMHLSLEDLRAAKPLADALRGMVREAGRDA